MQPDLPAFKRKQVTTMAACQSQWQSASVNAACFEWVHSPTFAAADAQPRDTGLGPHTPSNRARSCHLSQLSLMLSCCCCCCCYCYYCHYRYCCCRFCFCEDHYFHACLQNMCRLVDMDLLAEMLANMFKSDACTFHHRLGVFRCFRPDNPTGQHISLSLASFTA